MVGPDDRPRSGLDLRLAIGSDLPTKDGSPGGKVDNDEVVRMIERDLAAHVRDLLVETRIPSSPRDPTLRALEPDTGLIRRLASRTADSAGCDPLPN